jgi:hypothetical protein
MIPRISLLPLLVAITVAASAGGLSTAAQPAAAGPQWGRSAEDLAVEQFLLSAEVVDIQDIGEGITRPRRLTLRQGGVERRAIFKTVDVDNVDLAYTDRFTTGFSDRYVNEVAAYRLDRLLGIGLVPPTVTRRVDDEEGSVQLWVENALSMQEVVDRGLPCRNVDLLLERLMQMYVLDTLIFNTDRNWGNVLVILETEGFHLVDHSRSFRTTRKLPDLQEQRPIPVPARVGLALRSLDLPNLQAELGDVLSKAQMRSVLARRDLLLEDLERRHLLEKATPQRMAGGGSPQEPRPPLPADGSGT